MLTSKQRAVLRGMANSMDTIFQVGKGGISDTLVAQTDDALRARELIKLRVLRIPATPPGRLRSSWQSRPVLRWYRSSAAGSCCTGAIRKSRSLI